MNCRSNPHISLSINTVSPIHLLGLFSVQLRPLASGAGAALANVVLHQFEDGGGRTEH